MVGGVGQDDDAGAITLARVGGRALHGLHAVDEASRTQFGKLLVDLRHERVTAPWFRAYQIAGTEACRYEHLPVRQQRGRMAVACRPEL